MIDFNLQTISNIYSRCPFARGNFVSFAFMSKITTRYIANSTVSDEKNVKPVGFLVVECANKKPDLEGIGQKDDYRGITCQ